MTFDPEHILGAYGVDGDAARAVVAADRHLQQGERALAASALDRAYGLAPDDENIRAQRAAVLDALAIEEHGLRFRYVPAGTFLMGDEHGDPDERPVHPRRVRGFHLTEVPITWAAYCSLMEWRPPPKGAPPAPDDLESLPWEARRPWFALHERNKLRLQYCETHTTGATDWHAHMPGASDHYSRPPGRAPDDAWAYDVKPMVAVGPEEAEELCERLSSDAVCYRLPSEAEWEKAARGGLINQPYAWGSAPPIPERCDFDRFGLFGLRDPRTFPPNGYGLYGMCGGVWEWTSDGYWALSHLAEVQRLERPAAWPERALRGGSWADCAQMVRVSARMSRAGGSWRDGEWSPAGSPTFGFRICRVTLVEDKLAPVTVAFDGSEDEPVENKGELDDLF